MLPKVLGYLVNDAGPEAELGRLTAWSCALLSACWGKLSLILSTIYSSPHSLRIHIEHKNASMTTSFSFLTTKLYNLFSPLLSSLFSPLGATMTSILRQIIAGPRVKHAESNLDLCYVTPFLIATSGPSGTYPQRAYRNPLDQLLKFLDKSHGEEWCIWEFRAEGTGYPDEEVRGKVRHYPWPDHHPPPFAVVPLVMAGMRNWLLDGTGESDPHHQRHHLGKLGEKLDGKHSKNRVIIVHCKAGKGRSGTMASSYLISECGWSKEDALQRFTERRMRPGFGEGVSIPSQLRWVDYVSRWTGGGKKYVSRPVEIMEIHVWGLREGVKVGIESFVEDGKKIKTFHVFKRCERKVVEGNAPGGEGLYDYLKDMADPAPAPPAKSKTVNMDGSQDMHAQVPTTSVHEDDTNAELDDEAGGSAVLFIPREPLIIPSSDINIDFERRNKARYGMTMVTSVAHVWFNTFFEGNGPEQDGVPDESGTFEIEWEKMDGIKGSLRKGTKALDRLSVVWRFAGSRRNSVVINEPARDEEVPEMQAADWKGGNHEAPGLGKDLGLRTESPGTADVSKASSVKSKVEEEEEMDDESVNMVKASGPDGEDLQPGTQPATRSHSPAPLLGSVSTQGGVDKGFDTASSTTPNRGSSA